ncbi:MAG: hypothetical protein A3C08_01860 [Candidatus Taylorbacteria bacterium RIFCSPHIGHO2_02_FULL_47_18]|uniref:Aminotransferase class V domain-containing protein n=1 Tax=Candidatus Taylorbacteria bacterium RIFCSPLOWO2_01_FULL_48_100 TaxID=1802322 RepID=A0A1G2NF86_9BACT|nr:MAG: hypothetical protein A2670_01950 [Candidatus Taylorbacteria bacterium RIFCSPHIGHO2_01_FULL_48_38]OHA28494.1 MAG: hypothetical protein A3C08_01860 [Candidatus Taylorbacteria bacterium RIFCSPHIGHO2_02_FULL_47_18]OHA34733.1 MAG: hypothetical protein A2938_02320 [Candidatus Taylorbacteria bacterium RIFCSPLOWO2_01_FULL_48_100]OHA40248.1 MAG: hypothetical protein A3J31_01565 [Candidatus Taylorbacteria bacterium RIFCSPLOWO2_02_FULL_48_16]OHA45418.1 MAG: hypothetical protein A3H13_01280 [Candid
MKRIYLDHASTTPLDARVRKVTEPYFAKNFGNPSSIHAEGVAAKKAVDEARVKVARALEARAEEIIFTSGGTEANNLAIFGVVNNSRKNVHIVTTNIEHSSVLKPLRELERQGSAEVSYIPVEPNGIVRAEKIISAIRPNTVLVSVQYANNEIGTIQPIAKIGKMIKALDAQSSRPIFHVDACQAPLHLNCLVNALGVDLLTLDGHKMYGPKGVGCLYVRRGTPLAPILFGGGQENGMRATTENVPAIVGFAEALRISRTERAKESARLSALRAHLYTSVLQNTSIRSRKIMVNGSMEACERLPNNLNISLLGIDTEMLTLQLDAKGIAVSTKSSCLKDEKISYVVAALDKNKSRASSTLRFTLGRGTTKKDIEYTIKVLIDILKKC